MPSNAPIQQILGAPQLSMEASKRDACLKAIEELHKLGALSDCLLPKQDDAEPEEQVSGSSEDEYEGQTSLLCHYFQCLSPVAINSLYKLYFVINC